MTVAELIEALRALPPEWKVQVWNRDPEYGDYERDVEITRHIPSETVLL